WAPDGKRIVYSSYLGRQWHQLWLTHIDNLAEPFPLTYGSFDVTAARWSPDGKRIAYIANENGNLEIRVQDFVGGKVSKLRADVRSYLQPMATLDLSVIASNDLPLAARVAIVAADGRSYAPDTAWVHADDSFDRDKSKREAQYFHVDGTVRITLPAGAARVTIWRGPEYAIAQDDIKLEADRANKLTVTMQRLPLPASWNTQVGGDVHVHMNYGGTYRATPQSLIAQAAAEDLDVVFNLLVNKEQRVPDIAYFSAQADEASTRNTLLLHSQENHTSFWGHLGILGLKSHLLVPDYSAYPYTGAASLFPDNTTVATLAREQGATIGYVHPFLSPPPDPAKDAKLTNALPIDAALGLVDYYEVIGFADHRASAEVWYGLLNCGMRIAAAGGTDAMSNYASLRGPVGINRTYVPLADVPTDPEQRRDNWLAGLKAGKSVATNGPLLGLTVEGYGPGAEITRGTGEHELKYAGYLRSAVPVDHLELVHNGKVVKSFKLDRARRSADISGTVAVEGSGWLLLRAWNDKADPLVFDLYPYASTSPVYVTVNGERPRSARDADYFLAWIGRVREGVMAHADYNDDSERPTILGHLADAERVYRACR
ncbi:MAG: CehA/McbA family metallohydrolase, partial [Woeseia sp.]